MHNAMDKMAFVEAQEDLLTLLLAEEEFAVAPADTLLPRDRTAAALLSFAQQRLWFLAQLEPDSPAYNIPNAVRLTGQLNISALQQSLSEILRRHEVLRTIFPTVEGRPVPVTVPAALVTLAFVDLRHLPESVQGPQAAQLATWEAQQPFDLAQGPLVRCTLLRLHAQVHVLLLTMHHIVSDAWSRGILIREMLSLYEAFSSGKASSLPDLAIQYEDFAHWQRQWLQGAVLETQMAYWQQQLGPGLPVLEFPTDHPRPALRTFQGARLSFELSPALTAALRALGQQEGVTTFMLLLAAFQTLLYRYTGQDDIPVGTPVAHRTRLETEGLIGLLVNILVVRTSLAGNPSFHELLQRVREVTMAAYTYQDVPFELLVDALRPARDPSHTPLFQMMFVFQHVPREKMALADLTLTPLRADSDTAKFDLTLSMLEGPDGLTGLLEYRTDLFDAPTIQRLAGHYQTLLASIVTNPAQRLAEVPLLTAGERYQLLRAWNDTHQDAALGISLPALFAAQVERTPDAVAVVYAEAAVTYHDLNARANQLAHYLRRSGVGPEVLVGLYMERSLDLIIGLLGILKAGGAYVPLDPAHPQERRRFMLEDSQTSVLLTHRRLHADLSTRRTQVVCLDADWTAIAQESTTNPVWDIMGEQLAYVLYTSGSTGQPKGVQIPHRAVVNFLQSMQRQPGLTAPDVLLAITTLGFDIAALEVFLPLLVGARVVLVSSAVAADGQQLQHTLADTLATVMQATPATWRLLLAAEWPGSEQLTVLCGGESLSRELAQQLLGQTAAVWNLYGPTETTIWSTVGRVTPGEGLVPLGHPIANTQLYVLDCHLQPLPIGVPGELYIGGSGVARGYVNHPELTAERFIADPFSGVSGARFYRTGDLVRYRPEGRLEFLGRIDQQVKLRGFRIELGEIEAVLCQHVGVSQAVVMARQERPGDTRLVAYVVTHPHCVLALSEIHGFLHTKLPDYMVPAAFIFLDTLPLTPNGKVDRRALPAPHPVPAALLEGFVAPHTPVETLLAGIWAQVLGIERVGRHDNFFELGGDSILSMQMIAKARLAGLQLTPRQVFQCQTPAELAAVADIIPDMPAPYGSRTGQSPTAGSETGADFLLAQLGREQLAQAFGEIVFEGEDA